MFFDSSTVVISDEDYWGNGKDAETHRMSGGRGAERTQTYF